RFRKARSQPAPLIEILPGAVAAGAPQAAVDCFEEAATGLDEGGWVVLGHESAHRIVSQVCVVERIEMRVVDCARGGSKGKEIVDRCGDLGGALVAVPHNAGDPARVSGAAADHASQFLAQAADARPLRPRVVVVPNCRRAAREVSDNEGEAALELVVVVAVEQVVL